MYPSLAAHPVCFRVGDVGQVDEDEATAAGVVAGLSAD